MVELGWYGALQILGALALFMYGMKVMSEGVQRIASIQLRDALQRVTQNKLSSFLTGFFTTAAIQSSSATVVMTVSFVNAGIISLAAAAGIIIGANLGTSVTVWMVTILGFELNLFTLCLPIIGLAMPFIYIQNGKYRHWAETVIGFSLLLIALQFLKSVVPELQRQSEIMAFLGRMSDDGFISILLFVFIGIIFTALIQSSSAAMALTLTMCLNGWLPFDIAAVMVLGENIGTTFTAEIAAWVGNTESKKAARFHVLFNVLGVAGFLPFVPFALPFVAWMMVNWFDAGNPYTNPQAMPVGLAIFYTFFNICCATLFLLMMNWFIRLSARTIKRKDPGIRKFQFIDTGTNSADLSLPIAMQEIIQQCHKVKNLNGLLNRIVNFTTESEFYEHLKYARNYLQTIQENHKAINQYLLGMVEDKSSVVTSKYIKSLLNINLLIDHIRNKYEHIYALIEEKRNQRVWFGPTQRSTLLHRINDASMMLKRCIQFLASGTFNKSSWRHLALDLSERNQEYLEYEKELLQELDRGEMKMASVITYYRIAQNLDSINESLRNILIELSDEPAQVSGKQILVGNS